MLEWTFKLFDMIVLKRSKTLQTAHNKETGAWFSAGSPGGYSWEFLVGVCRLVLQILTLLQTKKCRVDIHTRFQTTSKIHTRFQTWPLGSNYVMITYNRAQTKNLFKCISNLYISISFLFIWNWNDNYVHTGSRSSFEKRTRFHTPGQSLYPFSDPTAQKPYPLGRRGTYQRGLHTGVPNTPHWCDIDFLIHISFINYLLLQVLLYKKFLTSFGLHFYRFLQKPCEIRYFI